MIDYDVYPEYTDEDQLAEFGPPPPTVARLDGWAFQPNEPELRANDVRRAMRLRLLTAGRNKRHVAQHGHGRYDLYLEGFDEVVSVLGYRDLALLCDDNLCFGARIESDSIEPLEDGRVRRHAVVIVYTD